MTEFAAALNKQHRDEMAALSGAASTERIDALEKRLMKAESRLAKVEAALTDPRGLWNAAAAAPGTLPPASAANIAPPA